MYPAPSNPRRAAETDSPLPPAPLHHAALSPTHFPYRIRTAYIFELCIWLRPAACGKIPFTRYFGRDFSRYYGLLFRFLLEAKARSGQFIFDRAFWGWRHLSCRLFRVGTLEFEYRPGRFKRTASARHCSTLPYSVRIHSPGCPTFRSCAARFLRTGRALLCSARFVFV